MRQVCEFQMNESSGSNNDTFFLFFNKFISLASCALPGVFDPHSLTAI